MKRKKKRALILGIILLVFAFGIGYAYLNTTLNISGTTNVSSNEWNVYWDNVQVTQGSVTAETPEIDTNLTSVSFEVHLSKPGDYYEFTVDAVNDGSIDAMIDSITKTINNSTTIPDYLTYTVTYEDNAQIAENHLLYAEDFEVYKVRVEYKLDISEDELPTTAQTLSMAFGVEYIQADNNAVEVRTDLFTYSSTPLTIGQQIPNGFTTYDNFGDILDLTGDPFFIRHMVSGDLIVESFVGFMYNSNVFFIKGAVTEATNDPNPFFETNKGILHEAFGSANCTETTDEYSCTGSGLTAKMNKNNGKVEACSGMKCCIINYNGQSSCGNSA